MRAAAALIASGLAMLLAGCGFHPLYAVPGSAHGSMRADLG